MSRSIGLISRSSLAAAILVAYVVPAAHAAILRDPPRVEWGCELGLARVKTGISSGIAQRGWTVTDSSQSGVVVAQIVVRGRHTVIVDIEYDTRSFDVNYKSSEGVNHKVLDDGRVVIHRNANKWMANAQKDIVKQLSTMCVTDGS